MLRHNTSIMAFAGCICLAACAVVSRTGENGTVVSYKNRKKLQSITADSVETTIGLPPEKIYKPREINVSSHKDTIKVVNFNGKEMLLMNTFTDEKGEVTASQELDAAVVTARFRHLAERGGKVNLEYQIIVPEKLMDSNWQLRYRPVMHILGDEIELEQVLVTGKDYRRKQMRGYQLYNDFINKIITDSSAFIDMDRLEIFISRNLPAVYAFKNDSTLVFDDALEGVYGITEKEAVEHFTKKYLIRHNNYLASKKDKKYQKYVKAPIVTEKVRLDTVVNINGNIVYNYVQELDTKGKKRLKKVDIVLHGEIYEQGDLIYRMPATEPLTFYISSLSAFVDNTPRYITKIIERRATANKDYNIDFEIGKSDINRSLGRNAQTINEVKDQLMHLLNNDKFDLDSVTVTASASPEGNVNANAIISRNRGKNISDYFNKFMEHAIDSIKRDEGIRINYDETYVQKTEPIQSIRFTSKVLPENWDALSRLIETDTTLTHTDKEDYFALSDIKDQDEREKRMKKEPWYKYVKETLYPHLRNVTFRFYLHRKGMVKDTLHTTELDSVYLSGVQAIRDRDYDLAATILKPYDDFNTAVAYSALDRNHSALTILEKCEKTPEAKYMLAVLYARLGEDQKAVQAYMDACKDNHSFVHRGNLDPEISALIKKYDLNKQDDEEIF